MDSNVMWDKCVDFHGHSCGGLAIGYQASRYAMELLEIGETAKDETLVCITENDACGVDAIQTILGCTFGKGNLLVKLRGKQAFSIYNRANGRSVRLVLRPTPAKSREERIKWLMEGDYRDMFDVKDAVDEIPEKARIFKTCVCAKCSEPMSEKHARLDEGETVCEDCYRSYSRTL